MTSQLPANISSLAQGRLHSLPSSGLTGDLLISCVLREPAFDDLVKCCAHFGIPAVRKIFATMTAGSQIHPLAHAACTRMLENIEIGFARHEAALAQPVQQ